MLMLQGEKNFAFLLLLIEQLLYFHRITDRSTKYAPCKLGHYLRVASWSSQGKNSQEGGKC